MINSMANTFSGGIKLNDGKELSKDAPITTILPGPEMVYPLLQHIGNPSVPVVREGDHVLMGQKIAEADGDLSAHLHASVSGKVLGIENRLTADGQAVPSIIIANDRRYLEIFYPENRKLRYTSRQTMLHAIREAGIVGLGGSGLPTYFKLLGANTRRIDYCIANLVECEPYLTSDYRRILETPEKIVNGLRIMLTMFPRARGILAVSDSNQEGYRALKECTRQDERIYVRRLHDKYPQGSERQLIYALTGRTLNAKMLPYEIGCIVNNTDTLAAINQAVITHEPLITKIITVSGDAVREPANFRVRIGMSYREVLEAAGGLKPGLRPEECVYLDGGPMMGHRIDPGLDIPVTKLSSGIIVLTRKSMQASDPSACMRCGRCVEVCPNNLVPMQLFKDTEKGNEHAFIRHNGLECCDCGTCSYICPARINLSSSIVQMKNQILHDPDLAGDYARRYVRS